MKKGSVHDHFFRLAMSEPQVARAFFECHLPEKIKSIIKLDTLQSCKDNFVNARLKLAATDMLFSAEYAHRPGLLFFLPEHRSKPTRWQVFIILVYLVRTMEHYRKQTKDRYLPTIYPMVFYHGKKSYPRVSELSKLFDCPQDMTPPILCSQIHLVNLNTIADERLTTNNPWLNIMHTVMKYIYVLDILPHIEKLADAWYAVDQAGGYDFLEGTFNYLFTAANVKDYNKLLKVIQKNLYSNHARENVMTIAQQIREEGRQKGHQEGWWEAASAIKLLQSGVPIQQVVQLTNMPTDIVAMLEQELNFNIKRPV